MGGFIFNIVDVVIKSIGADIIKKFDDEIGKILEFLKDNDYDKVVESLSKIAPNFVKVLNSLGKSNFVKFSNIRDCFVYG